MCIQENMSCNREEKIKTGMSEGAIKIGDIIKYLNNNVYSRRRIAICKCGLLKWKGSKRCWTCHAKNRHGQLSRGNKMRWKK